MTTIGSEVRRAAPVGNRLVLIGAVLYLLEWVAIVAAQPPGPFGSGTRTADLVHSYATHAGGAAIAAAWFAVVLLGRVLVVAGLKASLRDSPRQLPLLDLALSAMALSVVMEIVAYSVVAGTARLAANGADPGVVVALDGAAHWVDLLIWGPVGVAVLACGLAMLRSRAFPPWLGWLAVVAGVAAIAGCLVYGTSDGSGSGAGDAVTSLAALCFWVWMLAVGIYLFRRAPAAEPAFAERPAG